MGYVKVGYGVVILVFLFGGFGGGIVFYWCCLVVGGYEKGMREKSLVWGLGNYYDNII